MINSDSIVIYYPPGAYGTFLEWCLNFFTNSKFNKTLPFDNSGSSHNFSKMMAFKYPAFNDLVNLGHWEPSIRVHPSAVSEQTWSTYQKGNDGPFQCMKTELDYIYNNYTKKIVVLYFNMNSILTGINNAVVKASVQNDSNTSNESIRQMFEYQQLSDLEKQLYFEPNIDNKIKIRLTLSGADQHASKWGHEKITDLDRWELREFISLNQIEAWASQFDQIIFDQLQYIFKDIVFIEIRDLETNFKQLVPDIIKKFNLPFVNQDQIDFVYTKWIKQQKFSNRDELVQKIVEYTVTNKNFDFCDAGLTLYDEALIQKLLRDRGFELKCFNLNVFPTNTINLRKKTIE